VNVVFCDTSALFAVLDRDNEAHAEAARSWRALLASETQLFTTNYVVVEMAALLQHRLGLDAVRRFQLDMMPIVELEWIDQTAHDRAMQALLTANRRRLSLVDCASFDAMRRLGITTSFEFDQHFMEQGFERYRPDAPQLRV
jgi:predicted nucleic acid-binding protein